MSGEEKLKKAERTKYHVVIASDPELVAKYILPCPEDKRCPTGGGPVRQIGGVNAFVTNYERSAHFKFKDDRLVWTEPEEGVRCAIIEGLDL